MLDNIISTLLKIFGGWDIKEFTCESKGVVEDIRRYPVGKTGSSTMLEIKFKDNEVVGNGFYETSSFGVYRRQNNIGEPTIGSEYCKQISGRVVGKTKGIFTR